MLRGKALDRRDSQGGSGMIGVEDVEAFNAYQAFHNQNYSYAFDITFDAVGDMAVIMPDVYGK